MKYKFQVKVFKTYFDDEIEVKVELSDDEVSQIKKLVADYEDTKEQPADEESYVPETSLLQILEQGNKELFDKFWWDTIYPRVFIEMLINGIENGYIEKYDEDDFDYENEDDFLDICDMYSDDIHIEHSSNCICRIPEEWRSK